MANIGTFTADKDGFTGTLRTLTLNVKVKLVPNDKGDNEKAPDFRVQAASHDIGAAWKKTSEAGREYLSVTLDDPSFPATVYARLIEGENGTHDLIWSRSSPRRRDRRSAPPIVAGRCAADRSTSSRHARGFAASCSFTTASNSWRTCASSSSALRGLSPA